ncbi:MAG: Gfo/Idh/MocA family oxidoreductase [Cytophagales bacterium]|nr:Gfo/Idh/MocA family oxidoreductase [Cytophagales bacterium]MDW8385197.1 Gfo/Idh/MocA family oxidoreductase [Flammeovirgaceae bacterium]
MKQVKVGIIGGGLMGREAASAFARWFVLNDFPVQPVLIALCDLNTSLFEWYKQIPTITQFTTSYHELLANPEVEVVYAAVPHNLHEQVYLDVIKAGKDLLAEKPFGIDLIAARRIEEAVRKSNSFVRCSSEFPFLPGPQRVIKEIQSGKLGKIISIRSAFHHASDLDETKPINWKRQVKTCGEIGVMGDLGMHVAHVPLRLGWKPKTVYAQLQKLVKERPDGKGGTAICDTWDNAIIHCSVEIDGILTPMTWETFRMAPTETNTWIIEVIGTKGGFKYSTKEPKTFWEYEISGKDQWWKKTDLGFTSVFPTITGAIFEPGFPDCFMQMLAAYFAEREGKLGNKFGCATPQEAVLSHEVFDAALLSHKEQRVVTL